jgi:hypothetical protein
MIQNTWGERMYVGPMVVGSSKERNYYEEIPTRMCVNNSKINIREMRCDGT